MSYSINSFSESLQEMRVKLVATLAHDIRNPLTAALLALDFMDCKDGEKRFNKVKELTIKSIRRSVDLVEGFLDAVSVRAGEGISLNFIEKDIVEDVKLVCWEFKESYANKINLLVENDIIEGVFDPSAIRRLLENLLTNAVKYGAKDEPITVSVEEDSDKLILKVFNIGNSISPEDQKNIFKFLNRAKKVNNSHNLESWGMGLTFVKMASEAHGGGVEVESGEGGTTFIVTINKYANKPGKRKIRLNFSE